jgi:condensin complex subunit 1
MSTRHFQILPINQESTPQSYPMRMALVEVLGSLIRELSSSEDMSTDSNQTHKQLNGLFELLISRTLDLSSYVRSKVLATLSKLCDLRVPFPKQRLNITRHAVAMLEDKASTVRKSAVALLTKLVITHPWGLMHGGPLNLEKWEGYYEEVKAKLAKLEDAVGKAVERGEGEGDEDEDDEDDDEDEDENGETEDQETEGDDDDDSAKDRKKKKKCVSLSFILTSLVTKYGQAKDGARRGDGRRRTERCS